MITFRRLTIDDRKAIDKFTSNFDSYSDFNFISLISWSLHSQTLFYLDDELFFIKMPDYNSQDYIYTFMIAKNFKKNLIKIFDYLNKSNYAQLRFNLLPEENIWEIEKILKDMKLKYNLQEDRDSFDYVLGTEKLLLAQGHEFARFRQRMSKFTKEWKGLLEIYNFDPNDRQDIKKAEKLLKEWVLSKTSSAVNLNHEFESLAFKRFIHVAQKASDIKFMSYSFKGDLVSLMGYEIVDSKYAIVHFAKYDRTIPNLLYYTLRELCRDLLKDGIKEVNIEQDLGIESLRHSKLQLRPVRFLKKYTLDITG